MYCLDQCVKMTFCDVLPRKILPYKLTNQSNTTKGQLTRLSRRNWQIKFRAQQDQLTSDWATALRLRGNRNCWVEVLFGYIDLDPQNRNNYLDLHDKKVNQIGFPTHRYCFSFDV